MPPQVRAANEFRVRIDYREPTYEARVGPKDCAYTWTYEVVAGNEQEAAEAALRKFFHTTRQSSVGWVREVVDVSVMPTVA